MNSECYHMSNDVISLFSKPKFVFYYSQNDCLPKLYAIRGKCKQKFDSAGIKWIHLSLFLFWCANAWWICMLISSEYCVRIVMNALIRWICLLRLPCIENANLIALHTAPMHLFAFGNFDGVHRISNNQVNKQFKRRHSLHFPLAAISCVVNSFQLVHA